MGIDGEGHSLLAHSESQGAPGSDAHPCILHLDGRLIAQIHLQLIGRAQGQRPFGRQAGIAHLKPGGVQLGLILVFASQYAVYLGHVLPLGLQLAHPLLQRRSAFVPTLLRTGLPRAQRQEHKQSQSQVSAQEAGGGCMSLFHIYK